MRHALFVTGTDTDVGKTLVSAAILKMAADRGLQTAAMKPVAAGCEHHMNADALSLQQQATISLSYPEVNPIALARPIAPHLAAQEENKTITVDRLAGFTRNMLGKKADLTVIEGAGGWRVPISHREMYSQYVQHMKLPVLLVVGIRLGCINHTLLTVEAILRDGVPLSGWIANQIDGHMLAATENIQTLERLIPAPCLGIVPFHASPSPETFSSYLNMDVLLQRLDEIKKISAE